MHNLLIICRFWLLMFSWRYRKHSKNRSNEQGNEVPHPAKNGYKRAGFSAQLHPCCIQGTPCCAIILTFHVPSFREWITICHATCHRIWGVRIRCIIQSVSHHSSFSFQRMYMYRMLQVTSWNPAVTWHAGTANRTQIRRKNSQSRVKKTPWTGVQREMSVPDLFGNCRTRNNRNAGTL